MDKETAVEIVLLKEKVANLEEKEKKWNSLIEKIVLKTIGWLGAAGVAGVAYGWQMSDHIRKSIADWITR